MSAIQERESQHPPIELLGPVPSSEKGKILRENGAREADNCEILLTVADAVGRQQLVGKWIGFRPGQALSNCNEINAYGGLKQVTKEEFDKLDFRKQLFVPNNVLFASKDLKDLAIFVYPDSEKQWSFLSVLEPKVPAYVACVKLDSAAQAAKAQQRK